MGKKSNMLLIDLNDPKTKSIAEIITSDTSRKILDFLAGIETASESEIAKELSLAISTVHYHMQKLQEAGLVDVSGFTYSKKGREINRYTLANKYIIITPRKMSGLKAKLRKILPIAAVPLGLGGVLKIVDIVNQSFFTATLESPIGFAESAVARDAIVAEGTSEDIVLETESAESYNGAELAEVDVEPAMLLDSTESLDAGFDFGLHEVAVVLVVISVLMVAGYFVWDWLVSREK